MMETTLNEESKHNQPIRAGQRLQGRYVLVNRIAKGGMGEVWRARDTQTGALVAAKVLRPELTGEEISLSRLRLEAQNAMKARHPNIAAVLDSGESNGQGWIVMELVAGKPLVDFVGEGKRLSAGDLIPVLTQVAYALDGSAQAGIVHRDIKPANIMIRDDGLVKLTDFGISYAEGQATLTAVGMVMGTAQYLAPEQAMGSVATFAGDLYSLGIIAYEALAGYRPFTGKSVVDIAMAHVHDPVPDLPHDVPTELANVVYSLLEKDPEDRPPSGIALVRSLKGAADALGVSTAPRPVKSLEGQPRIIPASGVRRKVKPKQSSTQKRTPTIPKPKAAPPTQAEASAAPRQEEALAAKKGPRKPAVKRPPQTPGYRKPTTATWIPLSEAGRDIRPVRAVGRKKSAPQQPGSPQKANDLIRQPGFWVLVAIGLALIIFIIASYIGAKNTVAASGTLSGTPTHSQEVGSWLTQADAF